MTKARIIRRYSFMENVYRACGHRASLTRWSVRKHNPSKPSQWLYESVVECDYCRATWQTVAVQPRGVTNNGR